MAKNSVRRELTRNDLAKRGAALLGVFGLLLGFTYLSGSGIVGGDPVVTADLKNAGGALRVGSDVKVRGVIIGRVSGISHGDVEGVQVDLAVKPDQLEQVPDNVVARILPATAFGTTFVELITHGAASPTSLVAGDRIAADSTQETLELQQALDDIDRLVKALGPAELASAIGSSALALEGRGAQVGEMFDQLDALLGRINPRMDLVRSDVRKLATAMEVVARVAPDLLDATEDGLVTLDTIATNEAQITALILGGTSLVTTADEFLDENQTRLVGFINNTATVLNAVYENRRVGITGSIRANRRIGPVAEAAHKHGFVDVDATLRTGTGQIPPYYTRAQRPSYGGGSANRASLAGMVAEADEAQEGDVQ
ncbi:MCE family protein [Nocardioides limicola]|uniref:MCE family protein n=1 Tax=Nocardioides limicola TaxID=2803368 RepID=UPI00193C1A56|nr:MCE family protein [Nocardioides sp. DJM-14]